MATGTGPLRFARLAYQGENSAGDEPRWHRAEKDYPRDHIHDMVSLCGYKVSWRYVLRNGVKTSRAQKPRGELCSKCEKSYAKAFALAAAIRAAQRKATERLGE